MSLDGKVLIFDAPEWGPYDWTGQGGGKYQSCL